MNNWQKLSEKKVFDGYHTILLKEFRLPNGKTAKIEVRQDSPVVNVLALTKENKVVLVKQFRPGFEKITQELPGGFIDEKEEPLEAIKREFLEETGYTGKFTQMGTSIHDPYSTRIKHNFVAINCYKVQSPQNDKNEFTEAIEVVLDDFKKALLAGKIPESDTAFIGLKFLELL